MKFIAGLLLGGLATLLVATFADYRWEPPSRMKMVAASAAPLASAIVPEPESEPEPEPKAVPEQDAPPPIRSVTIEPLPAEPEPTPAPKLASTPAPALALQPPVEPNTTAASAIETAVIWKPFHSEVSATGFARRLSTQLGYPFRALREGPARYHVVFDYDTEQQRELLQQQVTALTGFVAL